MKKLTYTWLIFCFLVLCGRVTVAQESEPNGKNLLNPERFYIHETGMYTVVPMSTAAATTYTFSMPSLNQIDEVTLIIYDEHHVYVNETNFAPEVCTNTSDILYCTITTVAASEGLHFEISGPMIEYYHTLYGFDLYQLEIGGVRTAYEPYVGVSAPDNPPEFQGEGTLVTSYTTYLPLDDIIGTHITVYDEIDGDLTDAIIITSDNYTGNEHLVGQYLVMLEVSDSSQNTAYYHLHIHVIDDVAPIITGPESMEVNVDSIVALADLIETNFTFFDDYDGVITQYEVIDDTYSATIADLGEKSVTIGIEDAAGNLTIKTFTILIIDDTPPEIHGPDAITLNLSEEANFETLLEYFTVSDNHTDPEGMLLSIVSHDLPLDFAQTGTFSMIIETEDASGNRAERTIVITIYDDLPPIIEGPDYYEVSYTTALLINHLRSALTVHDNYVSLSHDDLTIVENTYQGNEEAPGLYRVVFSVSDGTHTTTFTIHINVIDDIPPVFIIDHQIIIENGTALKAEDIINIIRTYDFVVAFNPVHIELLGFEGLSADAEAGSYQVEFLMVNDNQETRVHSLSVEVSNAIEPTLEGMTLYKIVMVLALMSVIHLVWRRLRKS